MKRFEIENELNRKYGQTIGWMANVINCHHRRPLRKIQGLAKLAAENRVCPGSFSMDWILIDGSAAKWSDLEQYA